MNATLAAWHWTWQDPVALGLAVVGVLLASWLWRRQLRTGPCASCPMAAEHGRRPSG